MSWEYYFENHDWDMTLKAAATLVQLGNAQPKGDDRTIEFSCHTGGMLLSFSSIESFTNSVAFCLARAAGDDSFDYQRYLKQRSFWGRVDAICDHLKIPADRSVEPFGTIDEMREWRNALVHTSPFALEPMLVEAPDKIPPLEPKLVRLDYAREVERERANAFYKATYDFIELVSSTSGIEPKAHVTYRHVGAENTVRIERAARDLNAEIEDSKD